MPDVNVYEAFKEIIQKLFSGDAEVAELAATDPEGLLAAYGVTDADLDGVDFREVVSETYQDYDLPGGTKQALDSYVAGEPAPAHYAVKQPPSHDGGYQGAEHAAQHLQYVTYATYENNEHITREIVNKQLLIDQSDNRIFEVDNSVALDGNFNGDVEVDTNNLNALGDGAIANSGDESIFTAGDGDVISASRGGEVNAATGDGAVAGGGDVVANTGRGDQFAATGDGNVAAATGDQSLAIGDDNDGQANTGDEAVVGDDIGSANTGRFDGIQAGDDVENAVAGDENQSAFLDLDTSGGTGGDSTGTGGAGTGAADQVDGFGESRDATVGSGRGGNGTAGDGGSGDGGAVGPINLNFGSGDQANTQTGDVSDSALATGREAQSSRDIDVEVDVEVEDSFNQQQPEGLFTEPSEAVEGTLEAAVEEPTGAGEQLDDTASLGA